MKRNHFLITGAIFAAATIASGTALAQSSGGANQQKKPETIRPDISGKGTSTGGTQSQRTQSGTPLPPHSPFAGTKELGHPNLVQDVKAAQRALKEQGHDPGPVDGMMGPRTREALKSFQTASGLETTGTLNPATAEKLGVEFGPSKGSSAMGTRKNSSGK